jgi:hypothetical protein
MFSNNGNDKLCFRFYCVKCDYGTSKKSSMENHNNSMKHKSNKIMLKLCSSKKGDCSTSKKSVLENQNKSIKYASNEIMPELCSIFICEKCSREYKNYSGLWRHKKKCNGDEKTELILNIIQQNTEFKDMLIGLNKQNQEQNKQNQEQNKQNQELQKQIIELSKNNTTNINNSMNNSHNKTFNLQVFLNETCKDAMNIMDFVDSIKFQLSDLESVGELGYINGLSKIIIRNLKALDENMRPVHCSDLKREKIYVKDAGKWEKECADNKILKNAIKYIAHKNVKMIPAFREKYPDCIYSDSRKSDQYNRLIIEAMGGDGNDEDMKSNKIISKIAKEVLIEK